MVLRPRPYRARHLQRTGAALRRFGRSWASVATMTALVVIACVEGPTGPGSHPPSMVSITVTLPEVTPAIWFPAGESLHVSVRRAGRAEPIVDTALVITASLRADVTVPMSQALESFVAAVEVLYSGSLYFLAFEALRLRAASDTAITLQAAYVGPGARAASFVLAVRDSTLRRGDTTSLVPVVRDSNGLRIENVPARYVSRRPSLVAVAPTGVVSAQPVPPDTARVAGYLPMGLGDSLVIRVRSRADSVAITGGNNQTGARLYPLAEPVTVLVLDDDGWPVAGETVQFQADSGDGSFAPPIAVTDGGGHASAVWILGSRVGSQGAAVIVEGVAQVRVSATAAPLPPDSVFVNPASATLTRLGATTQLIATVYDSVGEALTGLQFNWSSSRPNVVAVDSTGLARAVGDGVATITAAVNGAEGAAQVAVVRSVAAVVMAPDAAVLHATGRTQQFGATPVDSAGAPIPGKRFTWSSSETAVATVDSTGLATAAGDGTTTITAAVDGALGVASLMVDRVAATVLVSPAAAQLTAIGAAQQFTVEVRDSSGAALTGRPITWSVSPPGVVTVDSTGLATAVNQGTATIAASSGGVSGTAQVTVSIAIVYATEEIVFISTRDGNREIYTMEADGSAVRRITNTVEDEYRPAWAPDRSAIVFERDVEGTRQIFSVGAWGANEIQLTSDGENTRPRYSPDGTRIAFTSTRDGTAEVWVMAPDGSGQRRLVDQGNLDDAGAEFTVGDYFGDWSPDGTRIVFQRYECPEGCWSELRFADSAGADATVALYGSGPSVAHAVRWSPQGWRIAYTGAPWSGDTALTSAHNGYPIGDLPDHSASFDANAAFAGTWDRFVFESEDNGNHGIYVGNYGQIGVRLSPDDVAEFEPDHARPDQLSYLARVSVTGDTATAIDPGGTRQLSAVAHDQNGSAITPENGFVWYVAPVYPDYLVAQVDGTGLVTGRAGGRALIHARYGSVDVPADSVSVTVVHAAGTWAPTGPMVEGRYGHAGTALADGRVLITGGLTGYCGFGCVIVSSSTELFDPTTGMSTASGGMRAFRHEHTATLLQDGRVLLVGGRYGDFERTVQRTAEIYDPATGTTAYTDSLGKSDNPCCTGRRWHTATLLDDGRVLVAGGGGATSGNLSYSLRQSEVYDPAGGTFTSTGMMAVPRQQHTATLLADGRVLITGGMDAALQGGVRSAEIYTPGTGTFAATDSMTVGRREHAAVRLADGRVLVTGGYDYWAGRAIASADLYDPTTGEFTPTGDMVVARRGHQATLLPDGRVLITGGMYWSGGYFYPASSAETYDPATGTFSATGAMIQYRYNHVAVRLPDGHVAVFGATGGTLETTIERYRP